jgi:proline iminopeptidase
MELLRQHLGIDQWLLFGGSWGSTLGLAYAERNPHRVTEIVLGGVTTTQRTEIDWLYRGVAPLFPAQWDRFRAEVPLAQRDGDLVAAYHRLLQEPDPAIHMQAAREWYAWEAAVASVDSEATPEPRRLQPAWQLAFARIVTHYFCHNAGLEEGILLRQASVLAHIPGILVHGRLDLGSPLVTAWELAQAWPNSELVLVQS